MKGLGEGDIAPTGRCGGGKARIYIVGQVQEVKIPCSMGLHSNIQCHTYVRTYIHKMGAHKESNTCVHVNIHVRMYVCTKIYSYLSVSGVITRRGVFPRYS